MKRLALLALVPLLLGQAPASYVDIVVNNVRNNRGHVLAEICPRDAFLRPDCPWRASVPASAGSVTVRVAGMPPGEYAAQVYQDENDNEQVDRNFLGIPTEGVGFSNDPKFTFGPPRWEDAAFQLGPNGGRITLNLRYFN